MIGVLRTMKSLSLNSFLFVVGILCAPSLAHAVCPAAPVGSSADSVIQMVAGPDGLVQMGPNSVVDATEEGAIVYDATNDSIAVCNGTNWVVLGSDSLRTDCGSASELEWDGMAWQCTVAAGPPPPTGCPNIGDVCSDGTIYAGLSPDGNVPMYTTPADAPSLMSWNDGSSNLVSVPSVNCEVFGSRGAACSTGKSNSAVLAGITGTGAPLQAASYCESLSSYGRTDWYLPSTDELGVLYSNRNLGSLSGTFETSCVIGTVYTSSNQDSSFGPGAVVWIFTPDPMACLSTPDHENVIGGQSQPFSVRCVRR